MTTKLMKKLLLQCIFALFIIGACSPQKTEPSFEEIKKMMTDAIQTEDGRQALRHILAEEEFRELLILEQAEVKKSIEETLLSEKGAGFWKKKFEDPKFMEIFAKSLQDQQEDVMTKLMNDASFQKQLESFFKQPDMQKSLEDIMQSATMKEQYQKAIEDIIDSPLLQTKWEELIKQAGSIKLEKSDNQGNQEGNENEDAKKRKKSEDGS